jgi:hypothetical protein
MLAKLEKRLNTWSYKWLSRTRRLILVKSVLEAIPIYWMSLSWIPNEILENIRKICSKFMWAGNQEKIVLPRVKWATLDIPKTLGGWGLKNIFFF